jgi:uncharacterized protein YndB with AHSA1/START domain
MTERTASPATFVLERIYPAPAARVFAAWADQAIKDRWFVGPDDWTRTEFKHDFRVGGRDISRGGPPGGVDHHFHAEYQDIVPDQRIVFTSSMRLDERLITVSLTTIELAPAAGGTKLTLTEQGVFLDGWDAGGSDREQGTSMLLDQLGAELARQAVAV